MASFPHIKEDPPDWAAAAAHEGGLSNSSCASHEAKQEDSQKTAAAERAKSLEKAALWVQSGQNPWKKQHFWVQRGQNPPEKTALLGEESATSLEKQHFWVQRGQKESKILGTAFSGIYCVNSYSFRTSKK